MLGSLGYGLAKSLHFGKISFLPNQSSYEAVLMEIQL